jgi:hypothetical protein
MTYVRDIVNDLETYFAAIKPVAKNQRFVADFSCPAWHLLDGSGRTAKYPAVERGCLVHDRLARI